MLRRQSLNGAATTSIAKYNSVSNNFLTGNMATLSRQCCRVPSSVFRKSMKVSFSSSSFEKKESVHLFLNYYITKR